MLLVQVAQFIRLKYWHLDLEHNAPRCSWHSLLDWDGDTYILITMLRSAVDRVCSIEMVTPAGRASCSEVPVAQFVWLRLWHLQLEYNAPRWRWHNLFDWNGDTCSYSTIRRAAGGTVCSIELVTPAARAQCSEVQVAQFVQLRWWHLQLEHNAPCAGGTVYSIEILTPASRAQYSEVQLAQFVRLRCWHLQLEHNAPKCSWHSLFDWDGDTCS